MTEFWILDSEKIVFKKGWFYRAFDIQKFMEKITEDPRGGRIIGMNFDGKNIEFYTEVTKDTRDEP